MFIFTKIYIYENYTRNKKNTIEKRFINLISEDDQKRDRNMLKKLKFHKPVEFN